jgi:Protein of unknown function (DUF4238)
MKPLDTAANLALERIMRGDSASWDSEQRSAWTRYILSLMFRNPASVRVVRNYIVEMWDVGIKELEANYAEHRRETDPATFEEYFVRTHPAAAQIGATNMIAEIIDNARVGPTIFDMHWSRIDLASSNVTLLNSDRPIDRPLGLSDPRAYIAFPIGPRTLFLASNDPTLARRVSRGDHTKAAKLTNKTIVSQAQEFVWGVDDSQLQFVQKYMGTIPERVIISRTAVHEREAEDWLIISRQPPRLSCPTTAKSRRARRDGGVRQKLAAEVVEPRSWTSLPDKAPPHATTDHVPSQPPIYFSGITCRKDGNGAGIIQPIDISP